MTAHGQQSILSAHPRAIIGHDDAADPPQLEADLDLGSAGVEGVFYQFFDHTSWSLDDFASSDLVYHVIFE